jgi:hypothetical protein
MKREQLRQKYEGYLDQGHFVLCVTLSTYIKSAAYAYSDRTRQMWEQHFIRRVLRRLPYKAKAKLDYDYVMEESPEGHWHYHGLIAVESEFTDRFWKNNALHSQLEGDIRSLRRVGTQRPFKINSFEIEPIKSVRAWCGYIMKQQRGDDLHT